MRLPDWLRRLIQHIRWGKITVTVTATAGHGIPAEIEYRDCRGRVIGFQAYGAWYPGLPYRGEA